jgi:hypothetical protein
MKPHYLRTWSRVSLRNHLRSVITILLAETYSTPGYSCDPSSSFHRYRHENRQLRLNISMEKRILRLQDGFWRIRTDKGELADAERVSIRCGKLARSRSASSSRQRSRLNAVCLSEGRSWIVSGIGRTLFYCGPGGVESRRP